MIAYPHIDPVAIKIGPLAVRWYGLMYLISFILAYVVLSARAKAGRLRLDQNQLTDLITWSAIGVLAGGRLGYILFYDFSWYLANPLRIFAVWEGGMSFHGGLIGVIAMTWLFSRKNKVPFMELGDSAALAAPIGLGFGRIGNFINGELFGRVTDVPWAMVFPGQTLPRHPSQLYESFLEGLVLFLILWTLDRKKPPVGVLSGVFLTGYGTFRFLVEFFREPDSHIGYILGVFTRGQLLSLPVVLAGVAVIVLAVRKGRAGR